jgi:hypothetical protein
MFNYQVIDKTPTVFQIETILKYMKDNRESFNFNYMLSFKRPEPNVIIIDINNAHSGINYEVIFDNGNIISFEKCGVWMS